MNMKNKYTLGFLVIVFQILSTHTTVIAQNDWTDQEWNEPEGFLTSMVIPGEVYVGDKQGSDGSDILGAFIDGECRDVASPKKYYNAETDTYMYLFFSQPRSDEYSGKTVYFKYYDASRNMIYDIDETIEFIGDNVPDPNDPYHLWYVKNYENDITSFAAQNQSASADIENNTVSLHFAYGTDLSHVICTFNLSYRATADVNGSSVSSGDAFNFLQPLTFNITAENGETALWKTEAIYDENDKAVFEYFTIDKSVNRQLDFDNQTIDIVMPYGTELSSLKSVFEVSFGATVSIGTVEQISGQTATDFSETVSYTITSENNQNQKTWLVNVSLAPNNEAEIIDFKLPKQVGETLINKEELTVYAVVSRNCDISSLVATFNISEGATANVLGVEQISRQSVVDYTNPVEFIVTAANDTHKKSWTIIVENELNNATKIYSFSIDNQFGETIIDRTAHTITVNMPFDTDLSNLTADFELSDGATAYHSNEKIVAATTEIDYSTPIEIDVKAENQLVVQVWTVFVNELPNTVAYFDYFALSRQTGNLITDSETNSMTIEVDENADITNLVATFTLPEQAMAYVDNTEQISGTTENDFSHPVVYTLVAGNGDTYEWTITVVQQTGSTIEPERKLSIRCFPNPVANYISIQSTYLIHRFVVSDLSGKTLIDRTIQPSKTIELALNKYLQNSGIYFLKVQTKQVSVSEKIIYLDE